VTEAEPYTQPAVAGSGTIACALAATTSVIGPVRVLARSDASAGRAADRAREECSKIDGAAPERIEVTTDPGDLHGCDIVVEAVVEEVDAKARLLATLGDACAKADLATTTSSLSIADLANRSGHPHRVYGLHVFNPVHRMELIELCLPDGLRQGIGERAHAWCGALGKTAIEVPDQPGFVVNRLLFPYLFDAVRLAERTGMGSAEVDSCLELGAGHPMGPLRLLDFIGLDVAAAIGESLFADTGEERYRPPGLIEELIGAGKVGRKSGAGFYDYR
jgi:3-hydroxybutyryl-CoA dehydrogenase